MLVPTPLHPWAPPSILSLPFAPLRQRCPPTAAHPSAFCSVPLAGPSCSMPLCIGQAQKCPHHGLRGHQHPAHMPGQGAKQTARCSLNSSSSLMRLLPFAETTHSSQVQEGFVHLPHTINYHVCQDKQPALIIILLNIEQQTCLSRAWCIFLPVPGSSSGWAQQNAPEQVCTSV